MARIEPMPEMYIGVSVLAPFECPWFGEGKWVPFVAPLVVISLAVPFVVPFMVVSLRARGRSVVVSSVLKRW